MATSTIPVPKRVNPVMATCAVPAPVTGSEAEADGDADPEADGDAEVDADGDTDSDGDGDVDRDGEGDGLWWP